MDTRLHRGHEFRGLVLLTTSNASAGGHLVEHAWSNTSTGRRYQGLQLRLTPWRRDRYGDYLAQPALVVGFHPRIGRQLDGHTWRMRWRTLRWRIGLRYGLERGGAVTTGGESAADYASEPVAHRPA